MINLDSYTIIRKSDKKEVFSGTFVECEPYMNPDYRVIWNFDGSIIKY